MNLASFTRTPGTERPALARINEGAATLDTRVLPPTPMAWAVARFLRRIRDLVLTARGGGMATATNLAHLKKHVEVTAVRARQQLGDAQNLLSAATRVTDLSQWVEDFRTMTGTVQAIAGSMGEMACVSRELNTRIGAVSESAQLLHQPMGNAAEHVDELRQSTETIQGSLAVENKGYASPHNRLFSEPPTGDYGHDLAKRRHKRIFNDPVGIKRALNTKPFLFQTCLRDTGEMVSDLSMPIFVQGCHWGAVRVGLDSKRLC